MVETALKGKEEFIRRQKGVRSEADIAAQQLINIYRQLSVLGEEATQKYNQQLIRQINPEVVASLKTIPGGEEVHDYYNFLAHTDVQGNKDSPLDTQSDVLNSLLPSAEQLSPLWATYGTSGQPLKTVIQTSGEPLAVSVQSREMASQGDSFGGNSSFGGGSSFPARGVDMDKLRQVLTEQVEKQKESIRHIFECIVIDSDIEKMHQNLKNAVGNVMEQLDTQKEKLPDILDELKSSVKASAPVTETSENRKKMGSNVSYKNLRRKSEHKFSVDMSEEE